jgi:hypothetical protein
MPDMQKKWSMNHAESQSAFTLKVKMIKEVKLSEFGFKILHKILACPANLKTWKIKENDECTMCKQKDDIKHLLVDCQIA